MNECNYCGNELQPKVSFGARPIVNELSLQCSENAKQYLVEMTICDSCGLHQLIHEIDSVAFYTDYMTPSNWKNEPHILKLVEEIGALAKPHDSIIDIGCNDGKFLTALKNYGFDNLHGVEPTKNTASAAKNAGFRVTNDYLDIELAKNLVQENGKFDLVVTRQVLEHIKDIRSFLLSARMLLSDDGFLVIEVPDSEINLRHSDYGVWEEHLNYFTQTSLTRILKEMGWELTKWYRSVFSGWCQTLIATPGAIPKSLDIQRGRAGVSGEVVEFDAWVSSFKTFKTNARKQIDELVGEEGHVGLFGVGSRSISTLYSLDLMSRITKAYDDSLEKIGKHIPGTCIQIAPSAAIEKDEIQLILLGVNSENEAKVLPKLSYKKIQVKSILPPSQILLWDVYSDSPIVN
jgi:2-polyprenyl-3-methyl-5-hydroxy-6-metoxy-1,4-benzoquinol methylase